MQRYFPCSRLKVEHVLSTCHVVLMPPDLCLLLVPQTRLFQLCKICKDIVFIQDAVRTIPRDQMLHSSMGQREYITIDRCVH